MKLRRTGIAVGVAVGLLGCVAGAWHFRWAVARLFPIHYTGTVMRIATFHKGGINRNTEGTGQLNQFAIVFEDRMNCEGWDTSFAAVQEGDRIEIRAYHDVKGLPILNPEWWECDDAQLVAILPPR